MTTVASDTALAARDVVRRYGAVHAVNGATLTVPRGSLVSLLGPSGCGKTTTLRLLAGFEAPDAGTIEIDGRRVAGDGMWVAPDDRRVGMVFQDYALFPHLDVAANVAFGLGRGRRARARVTELIELVDLAGMERRRPHELSGGQQQRVALARALAPQPAVVLLDEPFSDLDAGLRTQVRADVERVMRADGATALLVTHDQEEALSFGDEVAVMRDGRVVQQAPPEDLYHCPTDRATAAFVGEADFVCGLASGGELVCDLGCLRLAEPVDGHVEAMVRPEDVSLVPDPGGDAVVELRQFFGHDQLLAVRLASGRLLRARLGPVTDLAPGDRCHVEVLRPLRSFPTEAAAS